MTGPARATVSAWLLVAVGGLVGAVAACAGSISDVDLFWHVEVGAYTLDGARFPHPDPWAFTRPDVHWHSTAWLSELVLAAVHRAWGWSGIVVLRALVTVAVMVALARLLLRTPAARDTWAAPVVVALVALPLVGYVQERPQTASLLFVIWLSARLYALLDRGELPSRLRFAAMTWLWACVHGLFVLAPVLLCVAAAGLVLDQGRAALDKLRGALLTAVVAAAAAALTPMGPRLLLSPLTVSSAARGFIAEWQPTPVTKPSAWGLFAMLGLLAVAWSRSQGRVPRSEVLVTVLLAVFGLWAIRNAGPVSLLLAPLVLRRMSLTWNTASTLRLPTRLVAGLAGVALVAALGSYLSYPALDGTQPDRIGDALAAHDGPPLRVLNDYNVSGFLISRAHGKVLLSGDGRADRYGRDFLAHYQVAIINAQGWRDEVEALRPDVAVLGKESVVGQLLVAELGWRVAIVDKSYALFVAPATQLPGT